jgi:Phage integrase family
MKASRACAATSTRSRRVGIGVAGRRSWIAVRCTGGADAGTLTVSGQLQQLGGRLVAGPPKSDAGRRGIALDKTTITALREHRLRQQAERAAAGTRWTETGYAFTTVTGTPFRPDRMTRLFAKLVAACGSPPVTLHGLRHGAATLALAAGADLKVVQDQFGHSTITLTADTYTSVLLETARTAADHTAALLFPASLPAGGLRQGGHPGAFRHGHAWATARAATPPDCTASPPCCGHRRDTRLTRGASAPGYAAATRAEPDVLYVHAGLPMPSQTLFRFVLPSTRADSPRAR